MFFLSPKIENLIDYATGEVPADRAHKIKICVDEAVSIAKRMIGCTLIIRKRKFVLTSLELYYGGIGDMAHDWYRAHFPHKVSKRCSLTQNLVVNDEGLIIYLNQKGNSNYKRVDLVLGRKDAALSILIRNVFDPDHNYHVAKKRGAPKKVVDYLGLTDSDHGKKFNCDDEFIFLDTHHHYNWSIEQNRRVVGGKYAGFGLKNNNNKFGMYEWNFTARTN